MNREVEEIIARVDGWLLPAEGRLLYRLAGECKGRGVIVEIGSWQGKSTILLGKGVAHENSKKIYAIDPHTGSTEHQDDQTPVWTFDKFKENIEKAGISEIVTPIVKFSHDAVDDVAEPVELLFIDGAHDYESVLQDFKDWSPKLIEGGVIAFHDTLGWPGPRRVVKENVFFSSQFRNARFVNSITYASKTRNNSWKDRLASRFVWYWHEIYELLFRAASWPPLKKLILKFKR